MTCNFLLFGTVQRRRFKTERNLKAELQRNPGILSRIKNVLSYESETYRNENSSGTASQQHHSLKGKATIS